MVTDNPIDVFRRTTESCTRAISAITSDQWSLPTPCSEWDVRALVHHLVYEDVWVPPLLEGKTIAEIGDQFEGELLGDDPVGAWAKASQRALEAAESTPIDRIVHLSFGDFPAGEYIGQLSTDHLIHGWDVARAVGADETLDPELMEWCYAVNKPAEDSLKASGAFGDKIDVDDGADLQVRLLAVFGRRF